jgi:YidC/Oxa1 family membrane protein insertase
MSNWPVIKQLAEIFGLIMRGIYISVSAFGIENLAICIFLFTLISKLVLLPSTYKRHKYTLLAPKIQPEVQDLLTKYENRLDHPLTKSKLNIDKGFILNKYGVKSSGGCLMILLQLPVLLALYGIVSNIEMHVPELTTLSPDLYQQAFSIFGINIMGSPGFAFTPKYIFPIAASLLQLVEMYQTSVMNKTVNNGKLAGGLSNAFAMMMTFYFTATLPIICGIYWISKSIVDIFFTFVLQSYIQSKNLDDFRIKSIKRKNKDRIKRGLEPLPI